MAEADKQLQEIGRVVGFFAHPSAAVIELTKGKLKAGERIYIKGHTTDLQQVVQSLQIDRQPIAEAKAGQTIGIKVDDRVRHNDVVYKVS